MDDEVDGRSLLDEIARKGPRDSSRDTHGRHNPGDIVIDLSGTPSVSQS